MAKINTLNYQTVSVWDGSTDLFIVEQADGTKVATPAQVKQFIEAGDFEATGEVKDGHGNILKNMAKSADVDAEIGDLSQTGLTGDSVAEQLNTVGDLLSDMSDIMDVKRIPYVTDTLTSIKTAFENGTIPAKLTGFTIGAINSVYGMSRVVFIAQNQSYDSSHPRYAAIYFGAFQPPHYCYKQDNAAWVDTAL
jgi:hypothetical protein